MDQKKIRCVLMLCGVLFLGGCKVSSFESKLQEVPDIRLEKIPATQIDNELKEEVSEKELQELAPADSKEVEQVRKEQGGSFHYNQLNEEEQTVYGEILYLLEQQELDVPLSTTDPDMTEKVFQCVLNDHPEIFYVDGYTITKYTLGEEVKKLTFSGTYTMTPEVIELRKKEIEQYRQTCFEGMSAAGTDQYEKAKYIYQYLIEHTEYDDQAPDNQNICSVFLHRRSVCQGYAKATQYLLQQAGIEATLIMGTVQNGEGHAWNLVFLDGDAYFIDTTWGDASYQILESNQEDEGNIPPINYDYLCVTTEQLMKTHRIDSIVSIPLCTARKDNYYVREELYFETVDQEQLSRVFTRAYNDGNSYVTIKCADENVYGQMRSFLIEEQGIFQFLNRETGTVSYAEMDEQQSLSFWL